MDSSSEARLLGAGHTWSTRQGHGEMQRHEWFDTYEARLCFVQAMKSTCFQLLRAKEDGMVPDATTQEGT